MFLIWKVRYLDTAAKHLADRILWLDTNTLDPVNKAAIELWNDLHNESNEREILRLKHLFNTEKLTPDQNRSLWEKCGGGRCFIISDYFEDENGSEITLNDVVRTISGDTTAIAFPRCAKQHDIDYILTEKVPIQISELHLTDEQLTVLAYFSRDLKELLKSAFLRDGPGTLRGTAGTDPILETAVTDEEIRSFITIFRRLYMLREEFNFLKAAKTSCEVLSRYPLGKWLEGAIKEYELKLEEKPHFVPFWSDGKCPFTYKRLIDVYIYTQYSHQPNKDRSRQYKECLEAVGNRLGLLTWLFLNALYTCSLNIIAPGKTITGLYESYSNRQNINTDIIDSVALHNPGIGSQEKKKDKFERLFNEKANELAQSIWISKGKPPGGHCQFLDEATLQLRNAMQ